MVGRLFKLLDRGGRRHAALLAVLGAISAALELFGAGALVVFMAVASRPELLSSGPRPDWPLPYLLVGLGVVCLLALSGSNLMGSLCSFLSLRFSHQQQSRLCAHLFRYYLHQPFEWHLLNHSSSLVHRLNQARQLAPQAFLPLLALISRSSTIMLLGSALLYLRPLATLAGLAVLGGIYSVIFLRSRRRSLATYAVEWDISQAMGRCLSEPILGIKNVRLAANEPSYERHYAALLEGAARQERIRLISHEIPRLLLQTLVYFALLGSVVALELLYGGGTRVVAEATFYAVVAYRLLPQVQQAFANISLLEHGQAILDRLYEELQAEVSPLPPPTSPLALEESWSLRNVTFAYPASEPIFEQLSLTVPRGRCIGIVGASGQGKTTLVNLLIGLLKPQSGTLEVDGRALDEPALRAFWTNIGYIPQDIFLTDDSLLHNITLGETPVDRERASRAAKLACLDEFINSLPQGYDTRIGDRGSRLSGGQRQRLGIARALYREPRILVMDEATSALDRGVEEEVIAAIKSLAGSHTVVMVSHQHASLSCCDQIFRVSDGGLKVDGSDEL